MLPELQLNDVVISHDLRVYYYKDNTSNFPLFSTSKDAYDSLFSDPQNYFKHLVSYNHCGAQFITDNFELVLRARSTLHLNRSYASFPHYAKSVQEVLHIKDGVNVALHNDKRVLFIYNLVSEQCQALYNKTIRLHEVI